MPELPEVQTIVSDLNKVLPGLKIAGAWTDWKKMIKNPKSFEEFKKELAGRKILNVKRRAKLILINLSGNKTLIIHQKMTGHMLYGKWKQNNKKEWKSVLPGPIKNDPQNRFLRLILNLSNGRQLSLSDLRKFAKVLIWDTDDLQNLKDLKNLGPEPLSPGFTFKKFLEIIKNKNSGIKTALMNPKIIAGIGNIYSDEILWEAGIHPLKKASKLSEKEIKKIYKAIPKILKTAIKAKGDSISDYRRPSGEKGKYQEIQKAYQREGEKCLKNDGGIIRRIKISGRSAHFCPVHQK